MRNNSLVIKVHHIYFKIVFYLREMFTKKNAHKTFFFFSNVLLGKFFLRFHSFCYVYSDIVKNYPRNTNTVFHLTDKKSQHNFFSTNVTKCEVYIYMLNIFITQKYF